MDGLIPYTARVPRKPSGDTRSGAASDEQALPADQSSSNGPRRPPRRERNLDDLSDVWDAPARTSAVDRGSVSGPSPAVRTPPPGFVAATQVVAPNPDASVGNPPAPTGTRAVDPGSERTTGTRRGRRVTRVIRRIEVWSVLKLALVLLTCLYIAVLATVVVVWGVAYSSGQVERLQQFLADVGLENYRFYGDRMFKAVAALGAIGVLAGTILAVLTTALVNLISEMTGGIRAVVIEEERLPGR